MIKRDKDKRHKDDHDVEVKNKTKKHERHADELEQTVNDLMQENKELTNKFQRLQADYANHQKRTPKMIADSVTYEKKAILRSLLPSLDNFAHAISAAKAKPDDVDAIVTGVEMIYQHLLDAIKNHGVEKIESVGQPFNPELHEAMMRRCEEDKEDDIVLEEFQAGYLLNGQTLRPAKVIVNKLPVTEEATPESQEEPEKVTPADAAQTYTEDQEPETAEGIDEKA